jgi:predicted molibdopterin-dependent oxidoreductase YjgC
MGCNIEIHNNRERAQRPHVASGERVMRLKPRHNAAVNQWWMCDEGRYAYHAIDRDRLTQVQRNERGALRAADRAGTILAGPAVSGAGEEVPRAAWRVATWDEGLRLIVEAIQPLRQAKRMERVGMLLSTHLTNEDLYVAKRFCAAFGIQRVAVQAAPMGRADALLMKADKSPNTRGAQALGFSFEAEALLQQAAHNELDVLYVFGHDLTDRHGQALVQHASERVRLFILQGSNQHPTVSLAHVVLPSAVYAEKDGTFTNGQGRVQRIRPAFPPLGEAKGDWQILVELGARLGVALPFPNSQAIFKELAAHEPAFKGLSYETISDQGAMLHDH